jgi:hypothetical protein
VFSRIFRSIFSKIEKSFLKIVDNKKRVDIFTGSWFSINTLSLAPSVRQRRVPEKVI